MSDDLRTRIAAAIWDRRKTCDCDRCVTCCEDDADAVIHAITKAAPPIVASAIRAYADEELMALRFHGDESAIAALEKLYREADQISAYATTHQRWKQ